MNSSNIDWTLRGLDNPDIIQHELLQRFENETGTAIVDNNNPACVLMEAFASLSAAQMKMMDDNVRPAIYPARAVTTVDLLKHISDYDYTDIFSAPCEVSITLIVEKSYIMTHSIEVPGKDYKKLVIPRSTQITIGEHVFGLYYPIEIRSRIESGAFTVVYDDSIPNPLKALDTNVLDFDFREFNGHKLAYIKIPVYQFRITNYDLQLIHHSGFKQPVEFSDKFYALRCWAEVLQNFGHDETEEDKYERQELDLAVAGQTYDPTKPTVVFTPDSESNECILEIPYIYFMENRIRGTLHVELYTTEGEVNYQVPYNTTETCVIDMFTHISQDEDDTYNSLTYAEPFRTMPALHALPQSSVIVGGSNGLDFEQIRNRVINGVETNVLQTPADIDAYFAAYGYTSTLYRDGITDRIFIVHAPVRDDENAIVAMSAIPTQFDFSRINEYGTIVKASDSESTYTVLPSTLYKFDQGKQICVPLTDSERSELLSLKPVDKVEAFNNNVFTLSPFHLQINASNRYPTTLSYDMLQCKRLARTHIADRDMMYGLALNSVNLDIERAKDAIKDHYRLTFRVSRVGFSTAVPVMESDEKGQAEKKIRVLVGLKNDDDQFKWAEAQWISTEPGDDDNSTNEVFELIVKPNYIFHQANNEHTCQMAFWDDDEFTDFHLTTEARVILLLRDKINLAASSLNPTDDSYVEIDGEQCLTTKFTSGQMVLPTSKRVMINSEVGLFNYFAMTEQKCVFQFGSVIDELDQRINLTYSEAVYKKHLTTKFRTLADPIYKTDEYGNLILDYTYRRVGEGTQHEYFVKDVLYFRQVYNEEEQKNYYIPYDPEYNTKIERDDIFIRDVSPTVQVLFKKGTMTCMTVSDKEQIVPNKYTGSNYLGCTVVGEHEQKSVLDSAALTTAIDNGVITNLENSPTVPRFVVTDAGDENSDLIGKFELKDAINARAISNTENIWALVGNRGDVGDKRRNVILTSKNALQYVIRHIANKRDGLAEEDPLRNFGDMMPGTFLLLKNDYSTPKQVQLGTIGEDSESKVYTRLYYKFRSLTQEEKESDERDLKSSEKNCWYCFVQGKSEATILAALDEEALEGPERNPKFYGFMYAISLVEGDKHETGRSDSLVKDLYISFLTTLKFTSSNEVFVESDDTVSNVSKTYYVKVSDGQYREATESDFNDDGSFVEGVTYYERSVLDHVFEVPDFSQMEKCAWDAHEIKQELDSDHLIVEAGKRYCYKDKEAAASGIVEWIDIVNTQVGYPITDFFRQEDAVDGKAYVKITEADCTDKDYAWEQNANRWPWEVSNWKMLTNMLGSDDETVLFTYLSTDNKFKLSSDWDRLHRYFEYSSDQVILDDHNKPLEDYEKPRTIQYLCDMLQMDAKLAQVTVQKEDTSLGSDFGDDGPTARRYPTTVVKILRNHFDTVGTARDTMFTNTRLFFEPIRSLGYADFNVGNNVIKNLPLDITMKFRLHVTKDVYEDDILLVQLKKQIVAIIDAQMDAGYVNCAEIANKITTEMNGSIKWVDVLGINGDPDLQTMKCSDKSVIAHLKHVLVSMDDGTTIDVERGLEIEAVVNE